MMKGSAIDLKLLNSSLNGDLEGVKTALSQGGCVSIISPFGNTPLWAAASNGHTEICELLFAHGSEDVNYKDDDGI